MTRTKEFDPGAALASARDLFWTREYQATSRADLVEHHGIGKASIYATGSKHDLYLQALDRYVQTRRPVELSKLSQLGPVLPAVRALVERYAAEAAEDDLGRGCFVVNTATERMPDDLEVARRVETSWGGLETALTSALIRAQAQGEITEERDPQAVARFVLIRAAGLARAWQRHLSRLQDGAREALRVLC